MIQAAKGGGLAVFLDRDGTINVDTGYLADPKEVVLIGRSAEAVKKLNEAGATVVIVSNQSGVGRGFFSFDRAMEVNGRVLELLGREGARIDASYICPHRPDEGCECRKPAPGMVLRARKELGIEGRRSYVVGDKESDMGLAKASGSTGVLLDRSGADIPKGGSLAAHVCGDLYGAVEWILKDWRGA